MAVSEKNNSLGMEERYRKKDFRYVTVGNAFSALSREFSQLPSEISSPDELVECFDLIIRSSDNLTTRYPSKITGFTPLESLYSRQAYRKLVIQLFDQRFPFRGIIHTHTHNPEETFAHVSGNAYRGLLEDISRYPRLTDAGEIYLFGCYENGEKPRHVLVDGKEIYMDDAPIDQIICANTGLIIAKAKAYETESIIFEDLVQAGLEHLWHAGLTFDYRKLHSFGSYAARYLQIIFHRLVDYRVHLHPGYIDEERIVTDNEGILERIAAEESASELLSKLDPDHAEVVALHANLFGTGTMKQTEIAEMRGVTKQRIGQMVGAAKAQLQLSMYLSGIRV